MKNKKFALKNLSILFILLATFTACDKDFVSLDSDISGQNNFEVDDEKYEVIAYNKKLNPIQTNSLPAYLLGYYKDLTYGSTTASVVTQLTPAVFDPKFPEKVRLDSVVLTIPYFSKSIKIENDVTTYRLDSIYGDEKINLKIYQNDYFLRSFDPNSGFNTPQKYYSDRSQSTTSQIPLSALQSTLIADTLGFKPSNKEIVLKDDKEITRLAPAIRLQLDTLFWKNQIMNKEGEPVLSNLNNFQNYFRGIYIEAEAIDNKGTLMMLNFRDANANITMHYSSPPKAEKDTIRVKGSYKMNFSNRTDAGDNNIKINFFDNNFILPIPDGDPNLGDEKLYLKGGQGSMAVIELFDGTNIDGDAGTMNPFEAFKNDYVETDADGKFVRAKRLVNEANLIFYVDQELTKGQEPDRIYLYDAKNKRVLVDYGLDLADAVNPINSRSSHLGKLQRVNDEKNSEGVKYKIKITEHIKNLLLRDSTNVSLGLAVSTNVDVEGGAAQNAILSSDNMQVKSLPVSSILSPKGTILYGNNTNKTDKKLYLEIFYTEPNK